MRRRAGAFGLLSFSPVDDDGDDDVEDVVEDGRFLPCPLLPTFGDDDEDDADVSELAFDPFFLESLDEPRFFDALASLSAAAFFFASVARAALAASLAFSAFSSSSSFLPRACLATQPTRVNPIDS